MAFTVTPEGRFIDINDAGLKLLSLENKGEALGCNVEDFYVDISERAKLVEKINEKGHVEGKQVRFRNKAGELIEVAVTAHAKVDDSGQLLYQEGIVHNMTKALEDERNKVLRNAAGSMRHFSDGISKAYERISEVTKAFNKVFHYKEECYVNSTILDIFSACGYEGEDKWHQRKRR